MANGSIAQTSFTDGAAIQSGAAVKVKAVHIYEIRNAITALQSYAGNVDNCGNCTYCQTCQNNTCQSCQSCQTCQSNCNCDCGCTHGEG